LAKSDKSDDELIHYKKAQDDEDSCKVDIKVVLKKYIEEQVFPALVYIYPPAKREMLSESDILCENFVNSH
jgi:hypothetical protein